MLESMRPMFLLYLYQSPKILQISDTVHIL